MAEQRDAGGAGRSHGPRRATSGRRSSPWRPSTSVTAATRTRKWADVAGAVGVGSTALYHYFESKLHCLYVIMADAIEDARVDFDRITAEAEFARRG